MSKTTKISNASGEDTGHEVTVVWLADLADGESQAVEQFWDNYGDSLRRVAERQIASWMRHRVDAEDVVQSACRTFFRRAGEGSFELDNKDDLWKLMLTITLNKVRMQARYHSRNRRDVSKEQSMPEEANLQPAEWDRAIEQVDLEDMLNAAFSKDDGERRKVLEMWLAGHKQAEIAKEVGCSERTVRRIQDRIRSDLDGFRTQVEEDLSGSDITR